tara:strand:- start:83 stop:1828 length:1746 start_codon:yes stop_codon:yes gene_type:complete
MNINSLLPQNGQANQNAAAIALERKWEKTGLLEGMSTEVERKGMAVLLENQAKQLVSEANSTNTAKNGEEWAGVALPLVRRIFAEIAAKDFVSVQPMNLPSGLIFYLDFKYGTSQGTAGFSNTESGNDFLTGQGRESQKDSVFGVTDTSRQKGTSGATEGLYGPGRFGYTINDVNKDFDDLGEYGGAAPSTGSYNPITDAFTSQLTSLTQAQFDLFTNYNAEFSASAVNNARLFSVIAIPSGGLDTPDMNGVRGWNLSGSGVTTIFPEFTRVTPNKSHALFLAQVGAATSWQGDAVDGFEVAYAKQPNDITRGDFEDQAPGEFANGSTELDIPEINLEMRSEAIVAKTRKLKAVWTPEFAQDLNAYHSIDAEAELTSMLSEYVSQEIDLEILDMLIQNAQTVDRWSAKIGFEFDAASNTFNQSNATAQAYNQGTWFQTLGTKIQKVSNKIHQLTLRGGANFLVCSPTIATILESIPGYAADTDGDKMQFAMGVQKVGSINSRFQVYKNPYMTENTILLGYRGSQFLETGAVYSPYIPLIMTPLVYDPDNFTPRKGVMTRYAKKMVRPEFYGKVFVAGLDTI